MKWMQKGMQGLVAGLLIVGAAATARAAMDSPITFATAGVVTLTLEGSSGGYDHILEMASTTGPIGTPVMALTDWSDPSALVLGYTPAALGDSVVLGSFSAGDELIFRLTNVESHRLGTPGTLADQTFTGTSSPLNPAPDYTYVDFTSPTTAYVYWEDLFPPVVPGGEDVIFSLELTPVPEPQALVMVLTGLGLVGWVGRRRHARLD